MKSLLTSMLLFCISAVTYSQITDVEDDKLKGKVKSVSFISYSQDPGEERRFGRKSFTSYNEKGFLSEYSSFENEIGAKDFMIIPTYNQKGIRNYDSNFNKGRVYDGKSIYSYDKLGNRIEWVEYSSNDTIIIRHAFKFNSKKQMVKHLLYNNKNELLGTVEYILDTKGNVLSRISSKADGTVEYQYSYVYDIKGNTISEKYKNSERKREYFLKMKYDDYGNMVLQEEYDENGKLEEQKSISYKYDKYNNWVDKSATIIRYYDKSSYEVYEMEYREITYY